MATTIKLKNSVTTTNAPSSLVQGEVAINITDKKVWVGNAATTPIQLLGDGGSASFTSIAFGAGTVSSPSITFTGDTNTGIYSPAADTIAFTEGGTEAMRIDSSGNVGIGTSTITSSAGWSPRLVLAGTDTALIVKGGSGQENSFGASGGLYIDCLGNSTGTNNNIIFRNTSTNSSYNSTERMRITSAGDVGIGTSSPSSKLTVQGAIRHEFASNTALYTTVNYDGISVKGAQDAYYLVDSGQNQTWYVGATERMRITSGGEVCVGTTNPSGTAGAGAKIVSTTGGFTYAQVTAETTNANATAYNYYSTGAGAYRFYVGAGGTVYATSTTITGISDVRLKENIQDIDVGLDALMALRPRKFDWKEGKGKDKKGDRGWIAQEFETVFPDMIDEWKDPAPEGEEPYKAVNADLIPVLVKAIQEQQAQIEQLKAKVTALENK